MLLCDFFCFYSDKYELAKPCWSGQRFKEVKIQWFKCNRYSKNIDFKKYLTFEKNHFSCSLDVDNEAKKLLGLGQKHLVMGDIPAAVNAFQEAASLL